MVAQVQARQARQKEKKIKKSSNPKGLKKKATVWVAEEDDLDEEADQCVWKATGVKKAGDRQMEGKIVSGWWSLDFDGQQYHYTAFFRPRRTRESTF